MLATMLKRISLALIGAVAFVSLVILIAGSLAIPSVVPFIGLLFRGLLLGLAGFVILAVAYGAVIAAQIPPLRPVAEVSVLGKHLVGVSKSVLSLGVFFGGMIITWIITLDVALQTQKPSFDPVKMMGSLWQLFLAVAPFIAYFYWMWIAADLIRVGRRGRLSASERFWKRMHRPTEAWQFTLRRVSRSLALTPGVWIFGAYYVAPLFLLLLGVQAWEMISQYLM